MTQASEPVDFVISNRLCSNVESRMLTKILRQGLKIALQSGSEHFRTESRVAYAVFFVELGAAEYIFIVKGIETAVIICNDCISKPSDLSAHSLEHLP